MYARGTRGVTGDRRLGVLDLTGFEVALAPLVALVTAGVRAAVRAGSLDVPVREELVVDGVVRDHDLLLVEMTALVEVADELLGHLRVRLVVGVPVVVELDVELRERRGVLLVPVERELLGGDPFLLGVDCDGGPVHIRAGDERGLLTESFERAPVHVAADVGSEVADVEVAVGVRQSTGHHRRVVGGEVVVAHVVCIEVSWIRA